MKKIQVNTLISGCKHYSLFDVKGYNFYMVCFDLKNSRKMSDVKRFVAQKRLLKLLDKFKKMGYKINLYDGSKDVLMRGDAIAVVCPIKDKAKMANEVLAFKKAVLVQAKKILHNIEFRSCGSFCDDFSLASYQYNSARKIFGILTEKMKTDR